MLRPSRPLRRSIDGRPRESISGSSSSGGGAGEQGGRGSVLLARRISTRSRDASVSSAPPSGEGRATVAPSLPTPHASANTRSATPLPFLRSCTAGESYKVSDLRRAQSPAQGLASSAPAAASDDARRAAADATAADHVGGCADGGPRRPASPPVVSTPHYAFLHGCFADAERSPCMPPSAQRLFSSAEVAVLRSEARQAYSRRQRMDERRELFTAEAEARMVLTGAATDDLSAVRGRERAEREARMRAASAAALPVQYLEQRIRRRIDDEYVQRDAQLREEGRDAWKRQVEADKAANMDAGTREAERRAASHRFPAAATFITVQEMAQRKCVEADSAGFWETFEQAVAEDRADAERRALERFLNTPEQLALAAAREQRERQQARRTARLLKLFQDQQDGFVKGCRHGTGGMSLFAGDAPKKVCGRCRLKWDEDLGYYVSMDRAIKIHPPPPPVAPAPPVVEGGTTTSPAAKVPSKAAKRGSVLPPIKKKKAPG